MREEDKQTSDSAMKVSYVIELSLNFVVEISTPGTMKLRGSIADKEAVVLIDCGVTHNFINQRLVEGLSLLYADTTSCGVIMGSGETK